jgi:hypothetical protein
MKRYEQATRVVTALFAVLLAFGLKHLIDSNGLSAEYKWPCFLATLFLFLRFMIGSANHMWYEFVLPDLDLKVKPLGDVTRQVRADFAFLIWFGLIGTIICLSNSIDEFLRLNLTLTASALLWGIVNFLAAFAKRRTSRWNFWIGINACQSFVIWMVWYFSLPGTLGKIGDFGMATALLHHLPANWEQVIAGWDTIICALSLVYLGALWTDLIFQLRMLAMAEVTPGPKSSDGAPAANGTEAFAAAAGAAVRAAAADGIANTVAAAATQTVTVVPTSPAAEAKAKAGAAAAEARARANAAKAANEAMKLATGAEANVRAAAEEAEKRATDAATNARVANEKEVATRATVAEASAPAAKA